MSRTNVLVSAEWAEQNLDTPHTVVVEVDEDDTADERAVVRPAATTGA